MLQDFFSPYWRISGYFPQFLDPPEIIPILGRDWIFVEGVCPLERVKTSQNQAERPVSALGFKTENNPC